MFNNLNYGCTIWGNLVMSDISDQYCDYNMTFNTWTNSKKNKHVLICDTGRFLDRTLCKDQNNELLGFKRGDKSLMFRVSLVLRKCPMTGSPLHNESEEHVAPTQFLHEVLIWLNISEWNTQTPQFNRVFLWSLKS